MLIVVVVGFEQNPKILSHTALAAAPEGRIDRNLLRFTKEEDTDKIMEVVANGAVVVANNNNAGGRGRNNQQAAKVRVTSE